MMAPAETRLDNQIFGLSFDLSIVQREAAIGTYEYTER